MYGQSFLLTFFRLGRYLTTINTYILMVFHCPIRLPFLNVCRIGNCRFSTVTSHTSQFHIRTCVRGTYPHKKSAFNQVLESFARGI